MNIRKTGCSILSIALTALAVASSGHTSKGDGEAIITQVSTNEVYGLLPKENLGFLIQSGWDIYPRPSINGETYGKGMTKIEFYLGEKTLLVQAGPGALYVKGFTSRTGGLTSLTTGERRILKKALETNDKVELGEHTELFQSSLNLLSSWPKNMLVFIWHDDDKAMSAAGKNRLATMSRKDFNERNTAAIKLVRLDRRAVENLTPPVLDMTATDVRELVTVQSVTSICFAIGRRYASTYFECDDSFCIGRTTHRYLHSVGGANCFGRCGAGCTGIPNGRRYTRDCFKHDSCVRNLGTFALSCDIMFTFCADDAINGRKCPRRFR